MKLIVNEMFHTFQGEGDFMGMNAFFIRLHGCSVHCPWCDSAGTWHPKHTPSDVMKLDADSITCAVASANPKIVVWTGGEPCLQDMTEATRMISDLGYESHLETCGAFEIKGHFDYIIVSPKWDAPPLQENLFKADAFKIIVENEWSIAKWWQYLGHHFGQQTTWLHPEWSQRENPFVLDKITATVKNNPKLNIRAGWQIHKEYLADLRDVRSRPPVPLGGNAENGY